MASRAAQLLRKAKAKKNIKVPRHVFHISDDEGNHRDFIVKGTEKQKIYTVDDTLLIIDACLEVILEALRNGETINLQGFGKLYPKYHKGRLTGMYDNKGERVVAKPHVIAKFDPGNGVKLAVRRYEMDLQERGEFTEDHFKKTGKNADVEAGDS